MTEQTAESVHIADWVLREGAEKITAAGAGGRPYYSAATVLRLLDKIAAAEALVEAWETEASHPGGHSLLVQVYRGHARELRAALGITTTSPASTPTTPTSARSGSRERP